MRIGEVARASGVGVETVRFYEQKGLIEQPARPAGGGYRDYPAVAVRRINFVRRAQDLGFALSEITELLALESGADARCVDVRRRAEGKRAEVRARIANLERIHRALDELIEACPGAGPARACSIIDAINRGDLHLRPLQEGESDERCDTAN